MSRFEAWIFHGSMVLVGGTGLVYAWMRYLLEPMDPFSVVNHPLQPLAQHGHVWVAPLLVFAVGLIWRAHVWKHWKQGRKRGRASGIALALTLVPMVASGYLIQTTVTTAWRNAWIVVHLVTSGLWLASYAIHLWIRIRKGKRRRSGQRVPTVAASSQDFPLSSGLHLRRRSGARFSGQRGR